VNTQRRRTTISRRRWALAKAEKAADQAGRTEGQADRELGRVLQTKITDMKEILLEGKLLAYLNKFDFRIFKMIPIAEMIRDHAGTVFYQRRFGTASFPERPPVDPPPATVQLRESRYVQQLFEVYSEKLAVQLDNPAQLAKLKRGPEGTEFAPIRRLRFRANGTSGCCRADAPRSAVDLSRAVFLSPRPRCRRNMSFDKRSFRAQYCREIFSLPVLSEPIPQYAACRLLWPPSSPAP
jgi:hypothetical protein